MQPSFLLSEQNLSRAPMWSASSCPHRCSCFFLIESLYKLESRASAVFLTGFISPLIVAYNPNCCISDSRMALLAELVDYQQKSQVFVTDVAAGCCFPCILLVLWCLVFYSLHYMQDLKFTLINFQCVGSHTQQ